MGFRPTSLELAPTATTIVDLEPDVEQILAKMPSKRRYNLRLSQRKGITVREGTEADISTFYRLLQITGQRQSFVPEPEYYLAGMWRILYPHGNIRMFLAEWEGEAIAGTFLVPFGDTVLFKRGAWSGQHGTVFPNEAMHWAGMQWARENGYRFYDLEGIDRDVAEAIVVETIVRGIRRH
jgi:lipid II:glycine glycyltransferase (peptidoglycan interpeptide bridge formation enzyme)